MDGRKRAGSCSLCDAELFHVKSLDAIGEAASFGAPHGHAMRAHLLLADGKLATATLCADCVPKAAGQMPLLWRRVLAAFAHERDRRGTHPARPAPSEAQRAIEEKNLLALAANVPLGILAVEKWSEAHG